MKSTARKHKPSSSAHLNRKGMFLNKEGQKDTQHSSQNHEAPFVQSQLSIGDKDDKHEQEADDVADQVAGHPDQPARAPFLGGGEATTPFSPGNNVHRKSFFEPEPEIEQADAPPVVQSKSNAEPDHQSNTPETNTQPSYSSASAIQTQTGDASEEVQQKETEESEDNDKDEDKNFESSLNKSKGEGSPLPSDVQSSMETSMGADFSGVRVHTDQQAGEMSQSINAQAFTHEQDIYFNEGKYSPSTSSGKHLLAHELTHTIQQGASVQKKTRLSKAQSGKIQRSWLGDAASAVGGAISSAAEFVGDSLEAGKDWLLGKFKSLITDVPGYELFTVVIGRDPIRDRTVNRNGRNFIEAGLDIIPNGADYKRKLQREGALGEAANWLDEQIAQMDIDPGEIMEQFNNWWDDLSLSDIGKPKEKLNELLRIFSGPMNRIIRFAKNVASKLLEIVKNYVLSKVVDFIKDKTTAYPLVTVILGEDPITKEQVDRSGMNILKGFIQLHPQGEEQLRQMKESGSLQRAANWIDRSITRVYKALTGIGTAFKRTWDKVSIESLLNPIDTFREIYGSFEKPVSEIFSFLWEVGSKILEFIKDALLRRLSAWAKETRGYPLITVLLGRDPFTWENVERTPMKLIRGFFSLLEGGIEKFNQLKESGAVQRLITWITGAVNSLNITWSYIRGLFINLWNTFSLSDLANPIAAFRRIINTLSEPIGRILSFIYEVIKAVIRFALEAMNFPFKTIQSIINNAMQAYEDIKADPIQFFLNLMNAVKKGFSQFFDNFVSHLMNGLRDWLFGQLSQAGIEPPADLSFRSVLGMVMEVLGITVENIWKRLAMKIGQEKVDRIRSAIDRLTGIWTFVKDVMERGPIAIWEKIQEKLSDLWSMVIDRIKNWIVTKIIKKVTAKLLSMLDPTGIMAVVNGFIAFYKAVQSLVNKLREMLQIVNSFVAGLANIAKGDITQAATFLENALARGIPVALSFLANQADLNNLGQKISEMIGGLRAKINEGIDWLIDKAMSIGKGVLNMAKSGANAIRKWWQKKKKFKTKKGKSHSLYFRGKSSSAQLVVASEEIPIKRLFNQKEKEISKSNNGDSSAKSAALSKARNVYGKIESTKKSINNTEDENNTKDENRQPQLETQLNEHFDTLAGHLVDLGISTASDSEIPPTSIEYDDKYGSEKGGHVIAEPLSFKNRNGSSQSLDPPGWKNHIETIPGYYDYYVRLHILSEKLGGSGSNKTNLTPGRKKENRNMEQQAETPADDLITDDKRVLWYEGEVTGYRSEEGYENFAKGIQIRYGFMEQKGSDDWERVGSVQYSNTFSVTKPDPKGSRDPIPNINTMPGNHWDDIKHLDHAPTREVFRNMVKDIEEEGDFSSFGAFENSQAYENAKKEHPTLDSFFQEAFDEGLIRKP